MWVRLNPNKGWVDVETITADIKKISKLVWVKEFLRVWFDVVFLSALLVTLIFIPFPEQFGLGLLRRKAMLVSAGFLSAHIMGKLAFPKVNWGKQGQEKLKALRIALYVICIYAWAEGG